MSVFRCPDCRGPLRDLACARCGAAYADPDGIPDLLGSSALASRARDIGTYYDALYLSRTDVWREQGHTDAFTRYVADLVEAAGPGCYLDVGCGEGFFLEATRRMDTFGVDLSRQALLRARERSAATVAVGIAERLPFPSGTFDVVTSIGAMEHFLDAGAATLEVRRVLKCGGRYIIALLTDVTFGERLSVKAREFVWPQPHPLALACWLLRRLSSQPRSESVRTLPQQPVQNGYRPRDAEALFRRSGFAVADRITLAAVPNAPLPGHYMRFYCLEAA